MSVIINIFSQAQYDQLESFSSGNQYGNFNGHTFYIIFKQEQAAQNFMDQLALEEIQVTTHFVPLHLSIMGEKLGYKKEGFPFEASVYKRLIRLPIYSHLEKEHVDLIINKIQKVLTEL